MEYLKAEDARKIADGHEQVSEVLEQVRAKAGEGGSYIALHELTQKSRDMLRKLGYRIECNPGDRFPYTVFW